MRYFLAILIFCFFKLLRWSWRVYTTEPPLMLESLQNQDTFLIGHWHGDEIVLSHFVRRFKAACLVSKSKDGDLMNIFIQLMGAKTARGSSHRGAIGGLKGLLRVTRKHKRNISLAVDGPKGPYHVIKPGIFELAKLTNNPIYVAGVSCDRSWLFKKAWNKAFLPKPFAKVAIYWQGPFFLPKEFTDIRDSRLADQLNEQFDIAKQQATKLIANPKS